MTLLKKINVMYIIVPPTNTSMASLWKLWLFVIIHRRVSISHIIMEAHSGLGVKPLY